MKTKLLVLFLLQLFIFSYFIQGGGSNQNATIGEIRQFVEKGTFELGDFTKITGDVSTYNNKKFSNKPPSRLFFAAPPYFLFYQIAQILGVDTTSDIYQLIASHFLTILCASLWGALIGLLMFFMLGDLFPRVSNNERLVLSFLFPLSTMVFVYSTTAFAHPFETFWFMLACYYFSKAIKFEEPKHLICLGLSFGVSLLVNQIFIFAAPIFYWYLVLKSQNKFKNFIILSSSVCIPMLPLFIYNYINFDNPLKGNRDFQDPWLINPNNFMGVFWIPRVSRILKVLFWSYRSLVPEQSYLLLFIPGLYLAIKEKLFDKAILVLFGVMIFIHLLFIAAYNGWHGGLAFGPRYLTAILPMFFLLSIPVYLRFKKTYIGLMILSSCMIFIVTSVDPFWCAEVIYRFPLFDCALPNFLSGNLSINKDLLFVSSTMTDQSYNLGQLMALKGLLSLGPLLIIFSVLLVYSFFQFINKKF